MVMGSSLWSKSLRVFLISIVGSGIMTYFTCTSCHTNAESYLWVTGFGFSVWFFLWMGNDVLTHYANDKISWVEFPIKRLVVGIIITTIYTTGIVLLIDFAWSQLVPFKIGNNRWIVGFSLILTFLVSLFLHGREFLIRWKQSAVREEQLQKENVRSQYESLKNQVNPHFLFNSLNALTNLVYEDQDKAARFIKQLSEVYRYVLDTREKEVVPLEDELKFIDAYLFLQKIRFGEKLKVEINLSGVQSSVAPLAMQMLLENAIKHNVVSEDNPLTLKLYSEENFIVIENSILKKNSLPEPTSGLGLQNIKRRYEFLSNTKVEISDSGDKFIVRLPIISTLV
ncbi:MAG: histidine kinase [Cyclobacteriaceae bacterium]|nr:histidine kinase [Cyclobacteriaceae bacterium]